MNKKNEEEKELVHQKRFREENLRCKRCGSLDTLYRAKTEVMWCRHCGFEWNTLEAGENELCNLT